MPSNDERLTLYAICWQDTCEPWGWAPDVGDSDSPPETWFWSREEAERALAQRGRPDDSAEWSVREYSVPAPRQIESVNPSSAVPGEAEERDAVLVRGVRCPACRSETVTVYGGSGLTCSLVGCPDPLAPQEALAAPASPTGEAGGETPSGDLWRPEAAMARALEAVDCSGESEDAAWVAIHALRTIGWDVVASTSDTDSTIAEECDRYGLHAPSPALLLRHIYANRDAALGALRFSNQLLRDRLAAAPGEAREGERVKLYRHSKWPEGAWRSVPHDPEVDWMIVRDSPDTTVAEFVRVDPAPVSSEED